MCGSDIEIEGSHPIEEGGIGSKPRRVFGLMIQDLPDGRGCFCHIREFLSRNLIYYLQRCLFKYVTLNILYKKRKLLMKLLRQLARAKAYEKPAYLHGLKPR